MLKNKTELKLRPALTNGFIYEADHWRSWYGHMDNIAVSVGSTVKKGQKIGTVSDKIASGDVPPHLHLALYGDREKNVVTAYSDMLKYSKPISPYWIPGLDDQSLYCDNENGDREPEGLYDMFFRESDMPK